MRLPARPSRVATLPTLATALALLATGCGSVLSTPTPAPATGAPATSGGTPAVTEGTPPAAGTPRVALETVITGLGSPIWVSGAGDGSGRLFVAEQDGRIRILRDGALVEPPFLDIADRVDGGGERGLLGVAFPTGFGPERPFAYVHYSARDGATTIGEFRLDPANPDRLDAGSERVVLSEPQPYTNHNGGWLGFDPDGMLLLALGDGGSGGDPENRASDLGSPLGKVLRIDVTKAEGGRQYGIPPDNPFVGRPDARPEILHLGLRNPFRASIDGETGDLWLGDVGQSAWEEVDVARSGQSGLDFGWRRWEGRHCFRPANGCDPAGVTQPVAEYSREGGCSVIGGVVYRGEAIPALRGQYLFADYCSGTLWAIDAASDGPSEPVVLLETGMSVSSVSTADDGEVWITDLGGQVLRLVPER